MNSRTKLLEAAEHFNRQRRTAKQRGIEWKLDFWDWLTIWEDSGHLHERGRRRGQFQMCREADRGAYCSSNVRIDKMEVNASEGQITKRRLRLERQASPSLYRGRPAPSVLSTVTSSN